jgi:hypothetical protein
LVLTLVVAGIWVQGDDEGDKPDYYDRSKYRSIGWSVTWVPVGQRDPDLFFRWDLFSNRGTAYEKGGYFSRDGFATQGYVFTISAGVIDPKTESVSQIKCQAWQDDHPIPSDMTGDPTKMIQCTAVAQW